MHSVHGHMRLVVAAAGPHMLVAMLLPKGLLMWSVMLARGPLPVAWACSVNPAPQRTTDSCALRSVGTATTTARRKSGPAAAAQSVSRQDGADRISEAAS